MNDPASPQEPTARQEPTVRFEPMRFDAVAGWVEDDHAAAFAAFLASARAMQSKPPKTRAFGIPGSALAEVGMRALAHEASGSGARTFFEDEFRPFLVVPGTGDGFFTGYYEPEVQGSRVRTQRFTVPIYRRPDDLADIDETDPPAGVPRGFAFARRTRDGHAPYPDRAAIESGTLAGRGLELAWIESPVDAFFIHIQGSARVILADDTVLRIAYAAKSGHPYTPIGQVLRESGALPAGGVTMQSIRAWLAAHPADARAAMWANCSFIFFREVETADPSSGPTGAAGVFLTAGRSLAVDRRLHTFHSPIWVETDVPEGRNTTALRRLLIAQDTGSAIVGPARGDIFFGSGDRAGAYAGAMQSKGRFVLLVPRGVTPEAAA